MSISTANICNFYDVTVVQRIDMLYAKGQGLLKLLSAIKEQMGHPTTCTDCLQEEMHRMVIWAPEDITLLP